MNRTGRGLPLLIGNSMPVRLPAEFCAKELAQYEPETATAIVEWTGAHPGSLFVDIGCSYGYFSCGVLFADPLANVLAVDADLPSLAIARSVCSLAPDVDRRLQVLHTLIGPNSIPGQSALEVSRRTAAALSDPALDIDPHSTNYVTLDSGLDVPELPRLSIDSLLLERLSQATTPCLIKCDVEGAEQLVLEGAGEVLSAYKPTLLVSVHPQYLSRFDSSVARIRSLLEGSGYDIDIIGIDHEEHWLCS